MLTPEAQAKHLAESDEPMEVDEDPVHAGLNPNDPAGDDDGLDDLIFVFENEDGVEQVNVVQNEPMDVDVGIGDIVVNVNETGDFNVQEDQS